MGRGRGREDILTRKCQEKMKMWNIKIRRRRRRRKRRRRRRRPRTGLVAIDSVVAAGGGSDGRGGGGAAADMTRRREQLGNRKIDEYISLFLFFGFLFFCFVQ